MQSNFLTSKIFLLSIISLGFFYGLNTADARLVFTNEVPEERSNEFILDINNDFDEYSIRFGENITAKINFNDLTDKFVINRNVDFGGNELQNIKLERLAAAPSCDGSNQGRIYFNTSDNDTYNCDGSTWQSLTNADGLTVNSTEQTIDYNILTVNTLSILSATSNNRPADDSFIVKTLGNNDIKTQIATNTTTRYFRTYQGSTWSNWESMKTSRYSGYTVDDWDQTDGTASYIGRTRDSDNKWLITLSVPGGFTYAQEDNNSGTTDFSTAWANRASLIYSSSFNR